jgi:hypothetical protein
MPKYSVLTPIEKNNVMHVPEGATKEKLMPSVSHGRPIPVDASGFIELSEEDAAHLIHGQVPLYQGKPDPVNGAEFRAKKASDEAAAAASDAAAKKAEYEEFLAFRAGNAKASADATDSIDEVPDAPTIKCVALKDFQFKGEKYKEGEERELTFATIRAMGREKIKVLDVDAYEAAKKDKK